MKSRELAARVASSFGSRGGASTADLLFPLIFAPTLVSVTPNTGTLAGGTSVDLAGMNFQPGAAVTFGGTPAVVTSVTPSHIIATTPAHAVGAVNVTVTNPDTQSSTLVNGFTYVFPVLIPDDAGTISHVVIVGGVFVDTFGVLWTENGVVPRVASQSMGFANGKSAEGIGPFTAANFFSSAPGLFSFASDFFITIIAKVTNGAMFFVEDSTGKGYGTSFATGHGTCEFGNGSVIQSVSTANTATVGTFAVLSVGKNGGTALAKLNAGTVATQAITSYLPSNGNQNAVLGKQIGGAAYGSEIVEMRVSTTLPTATLMTSLYVQITT